MIKNRHLIFIFVFLLFFIILPSCNSIGIYNKIIEKEEAVHEAWANVESVLQRRIDLIPNLIKIMKIYLKTENVLLDQIEKKRNNVRQIRIAGGILEDEKRFNDFSIAQDELSNAATIKRKILPISPFIIQLNQSIEACIFPSS